MAAKCNTFIVKRRKKGTRELPRNQWKRVTRCKGRKLKYKGGRRCRAGGRDWKMLVEQNFARMQPRTKREKARALAPARFISCE